MMMKKIIKITVISSIFIALLLSISNVLILNEYNDETIILSNYLYIIENEIDKAPEKIETDLLNKKLNYITLQHDKIHPNFRLSKAFEMEEFYEMVISLRAYVQHVHKQGGKIDNSIIESLNELTYHRRPMLFYGHFNYKTFSRNRRHFQTIYETLDKIGEKSQEISDLIDVLWID